MCDWQKTGQKQIRDIMQIYRRGFLYESAPLLSLLYVAAKNNVYPLKTVVMRAKYALTVHAARIWMQMYV